VVKQNKGINKKILEPLKNQVMMINSKKHLVFVLEMVHSNPSLKFCIVFLL